jgi:hypothetical protein
MVNLNKLKKSKWYKSGNILFMPAKIMEEHPWARSFGRYPDGAVEAIFVQSVRHLGFYNYDNRIFEIHTEYNDDDSIKRQYLYDADRSLTIENEEVEIPKSSDFQETIKAVFEMDEEQEHYRKMK